MKRNLALRAPCVLNARKYILSQHMPPQNDCNFQIMVEKILSNLKVSSRCSKHVLYINTKDALFAQNWQQVKLSYAATAHFLFYCGCRVRVILSVSIKAMSIYREPTLMFSLCIIQYNVIRAIEYILSWLYRIHCI